MIPAEGRPPRGRRRQARLSRSGDFDRVYKHGRSHANRYIVLYAFPRPESADVSTSRLGISVNRRVGGAVERNAVKRALREAFWALDERLARGHDFVLVARPDIAGLMGRDGAAGVASALKELASAAGVLERSV